MVKITWWFRSISAIWFSLYLQLVGCCILMKDVVLLLNNFHPINNLNYAVFNMCSNRSNDLLCGFSISRGMTILIQIVILHNYVCLWHITICSVFTVSWFYSFEGLISFCIIENIKRMQTVQIMQTVIKLLHLPV